jgi:ParB-like chromosome segregation protein Spo0J
MTAKTKEQDLFLPLTKLHFVEREKLQANDYNPNKVSEENLKLLTQSILSNGWTLPIVVRPDYTIIDGFHRWTVSGREPLLSKLEGKVPVVIVDHADGDANIYGTITHNRARGTHLLDPMKNIVKTLIDNGNTMDEISKQTGMKKEEIFRLSDFSRDDFLRLMTEGESEYSKAKFIGSY